MCVFLGELLHFGHCFGSNFFNFFFVIFFFLSSFYYFLLFFCFLLSAFVSICDFILFWYFSSCLFFFSFPFLPFSAALSVYVTRLLMKGTFSILVKGYKECLSIGQENQEQEETSEEALGDKNLSFLSTLLCVFQGDCYRSLLACFALLCFA